MPHLPEACQDISDAIDELFELKTLHLGTSIYPSKAGARCAAVNQRAAAIPADRVTKARNLDIQYCAADPTIGPGPIEAT